MNRWTWVAFGALLVLLLAGYLTLSRAKEPPTGMNDGFEDFKVEEFEPADADPTAGDTDMTDMTDAVIDVTDAGAQDAEDVYDMTDVEDSNMPPEDNLPPGGMPDGAADDSMDDAAATDEALDEGNTPPADQ